MSSTDERSVGTTAAVAQAIRRAWVVEPRLFAAVAITVVSAGIVDAAFPLLLGITVAALTDQAPAAEVLTVAALLGGSLGIGWLLRTASGRLTFAFERRVGVHLRELFVTLESSAPTIRHFEDPAVLDRLYVLRGKSYALEQWYGSFLQTSAAAVRMLLTVSLVVAVQPTALWLVPLAVLPGVAGYIRGAVVERQETSSGSTRRRVSEFFSLGTSRSLAKEVRTLQLESKVSGWFDEAANSVYRSLRLSRTIAITCSVIAWLVFTVGVAIFLMVNVELRTAEVVIIASAVGQLSAVVSLASTEIPYLERWTRVSADLSWLEQYVEDDSAGDAPARRGTLRFDKVGFRYPGAEAYALKDVTFEVPFGSVCAVVGVNGAGKSTLASLIGKFYRPTEGSVSVDGHDIWSMDSSDYRSRMSGVYQSYFPFPGTIREYLTAASQRTVSDADLSSAIERAGLSTRLRETSAGLDTEIGSGATGSAEFSGGQWQRLALARSYLRPDAEILILDEPSAALDPPTERAIFADIIERARAEHRRSTVFLITHRIEAVELADVVLVFDAGRLVQIGNHRSLSVQDGLYAELYALQQDGA